MAPTITLPIDDIVFHQSVPIHLRAGSPIRAFFVLLFKDNFLWSWLHGKRNSRADMEGPYYVIGAPERRLEEGKVLLASYHELKHSVPYLLDLSILTPRGDPIPNALVDWWQADSHGVYTSWSYRLRGKFRTDANGKIQVLTVIPGKYGPQSWARVGHFHCFMSGKTLKGSEEKQWQSLTTQVYVCKDNNAKEMDTDFLNIFRNARPANMVTSYAISPPSGTGEPFMTLPLLPASDTDTAAAVNWWNAKLQSVTGDGEIEIFGCGATEIRLNEKRSWF